MIVKSFAFVLLSIAMLCGTVRIAMAIGDSDGQSSQDELSVTRSQLQQAKQKIDELERQLAAGNLENAKRRIGELVIQLHAKDSEIAALRSNAHENSKKLREDLALQAEELTQAKRRVVEVEQQMVGGKGQELTQAKRRAAEAEGKYIKQTGGRGQYGHCYLTVEPSEPGLGLEFVNKIVGGAVPREYIPAIEKGVKERMETGVLAGYPMRDVRVTLTDGSYHDVDSNEMAFKIAASMAFQDACKRADPVLLEPIMKVEVLVPQEYMGDVIGNLNGRRGKIQGIKVRAGSQAIDAAVPLSEMFGYATDLRSRTQGRATYSMEFEQYEQVPKQIAEAIIAKNRGE